MTIGDWTYYNHGWLPTCAPHQIPDTTPLTNGELFKNGGVLARYTTEYDCGYETEWWYVIKDDVFDINALKSKRRYIVKQGEKNFDVRIIEPEKYAEGIFAVAEKAFSVYPKKYRPDLNKENFIKEVCEWSTGGGTLYGAFSRTDDSLCGYALIMEHERHIEFLIQKTDPAYENQQVNAALVYKIVLDLAPQLREGKYICDGAGNILHETHFPEYLEKYFGFRKAYCKLHVMYAPRYKRLVKLLYPFRQIFKKFDSIGKVHQLNGVLAMEEIVRRQIK